MTVEAVSAPPSAFPHPVFDSQATFRALMLAMAYAGRIVELKRLPVAPAPLEPGTAAVCLTLLDLDTPIWLDPAAASADAVAYLRFHCAAPIVSDSRAARFAVIAEPRDMPRLRDFDPGSDSYPDRSTTLVLQVVSLTDGPERALSGPGIQSSRGCRIAGLADWFWSDWQLNRELYPRGVDLILVAGARVLCLPRTTRVEA